MFTRVVCNSKKFARLQNKEKINVKGRTFMKFMKLLNVTTFEKLSAFYGGISFYLVIIIHTIEILLQMGKL